MSKSEVGGDTEKKSEVDFLSAERDARFKEWLQHKTLKEKALEYLGKLHDDRGKEEEECIQVGVAMCAINKLMGNDGDGDGGADDDEGNDDEDAAAAPKDDGKDKKKKNVIRNAWIKFVMTRHSFSDIKFSEKDLKPLTRGKIAVMKEYYLNEKPAEDHSMVCPSLKYVKAEARPPTPDEKLLNKYFMREVKRLWAAAQQSFQTQLKELCDARASGVVPDSSRAAPSSSATDRADAKSASRGDGEGSKSKGESGGGGAATARSAAPSSVGGDGNLSVAKLEMWALNELSLKRFRAWLEEDEDLFDQRHREEKREKAQRAKVAHASYVSRADDEEYVSKAEEKRKAKDAAEEAKADAERKKALAKDSFEEWAVQKEIREGALKCLVLLPQPWIIKEHGERTLCVEPEDRVRKERDLPAEDEATLATRMSIVSTAPKQSAVDALYALRAKDKGSFEHIVDVGRALKKIDRTLLPDWSRWCEKVVPFNLASVFWDSFEPMACDMHSAVTSSVKDAFLKMLKPGIDFKSVFADYAKTKCRPLRDLENDFNHAKKKGGRYYSMERDEKVEWLADVAEKRKKILADMAISKNDLKELLDQMGVVLKPAELRMLIDSFDIDGDGKITIQEFTEFCAAGRAGLGPKSCRWFTTCCCTGMANAYTISELSAKQEARLLGLGGSDRDQAESKADDSRSEVDYAADSKAEGKRELTKVIRIQGEKRLQVELEERGKRERLLRDFGIVKSSADLGEYEDEYPPDEDEGGAPRKVFPNADKGNPSPCSFCQWENKHRKAGLEHLYSVSRVYRQEELIRNMLTNGKPPQAPRLWVNSRAAQGPSASSELEIRWELQKGDLVSFFCLEFAGVQGQGRETVYREVYRDPTSADANEEIMGGCTFPQDAFRFGLKLDRLLPGTSYQFRIRAFNGFGPGDYSYKVFSTRTEAPPAPRIQKISNESVTLRWVFSETFFKRLQDLRKLFDQADSDGSGSVDRDELVRALEERDSPSLKQFLHKKAASMGVDISQGFGALFDQIDSDDGGSLTWEEFESFFVGAGWADSKMSASMGFGPSASQASIRSSTASGGGSGRPSKQDVTYVVEQCESEFDNKYKEVMKTSQGQGTVHRLEAGKSYRFRVYSVNVDGVAGPKSDSVVVHTMLDTPAAPTLACIGAKSVSLSWKGRAANTSTRDPSAVQKMLSDWAGTHGDNDGGVSIETAFARYDTNGSGDIDAPELAKVLEDLGVEVSEERLSEAFSVLDANGDGIITFDEFAAWWRREEVVYVLKRSEPIYIARPDVRSSSASLAGSLAGSRLGGGRPAAGAVGRLGAIPEDRSVVGSTRGGSRLVAPAATTGRLEVALPIVVYRGDACRYQVLGLDPNRYFHFKLRYAGSRTNSLLSPSVAVMTAPLAPSAPLLIDVSSTSVRIKWYAPPNGAHKFVVQLKAKGSAGTRRPTAAAQDPAPGGNEGWIVVFNGQDTMWTSTTMVPNTDYDVRVLAANCQGTHSEPSAALCFSTLGRDVSQELVGPRFADSVFTIECTGDICVGDTILITERLFTAGGAGDGGPAAGAPGGSQILPSSGKTVASRAGTATGNSRGTVRMEMSVSSSQGSQAGLLPPGTFIGERTMACNVVRDNYRTSRDALTAAGVTPADSKRFGKGRKLWLEVVWQRASSDACRPYELKAGEVVERMQSSLEQFEVFRSPWKGEGEAQRKGLADEWASLADCYVNLEVEPLPSA